MVDIFVFWVVSPFAFHAEGFSGHGGHEVSHDGYEVAFSGYFEFGYGISGFVVCVGDSFDLSLELGEHSGSWALVSLVCAIFSNDG